LQYCNEKFSLLYSQKKGGGRRQKAEMERQRMEKRPGTWETARILRVPHALLSPGETGKRYPMVGFLLKLSPVLGIHQDEL
jgi:hypothetical protein